jgi:hypothetical protein
MATFGAEIQAISDSVLQKGQADLHALLPGRVPWPSALGAESFRPGSSFLILGADGIGLLSGPPVSCAWAPFMKPKRLSASFTSNPIVDSTSGYIGYK